MDKEAAAATRKKVLGMAAADGIPITGYHMPFPAVGFVEAMGERGKHSRSAVGVASLPFGVAVEVEAIFEVA